MWTYGTKKERSERPKSIVSPWSSHPSPHPSPQPQPPMDAAASSPPPRPVNVDPNAESAPNSATRLFRAEPAVEEPRTGPQTPPVGKHTVKRVLEQLRSSWLGITGEPKKVKTFDPNKACTLMLGRLEKYHLKRDAEGPAEAIRLVAENRPAYEFTRFFQDPQEVAAALQAGQSLTTVPTWSVPSKPMADEMVARGFVMLKHRPVLEWGDMPARTRSTPAGQAAASGSEPQAPAIFTMANRVPDIQGKTSAVQIFNAFERVVVLKESTGGSGQVRDVAYSPLHMWSEDVRRLIAEMHH